MMKELNRQRIFTKQREKNDLSKTEPKFCHHIETKQDLVSMLSLHGARSDYIKIFLLDFCDKYEYKGIKTIFSLDLDLFVYQCARSISKL